MLDAGQIDVICVCTPHPQHADPLVLAAERGIHGVVEKPMAATVADADRMLEAAAGPLARARIAGAGDAAPRYRPSLADGLQDDHRNLSGGLTLVLRETGHQCCLGSVEALAIVGLGDDGSGWKTPRANFERDLWIGDYVAVDHFWHLWFRGATRARP